MSFTSLYWLCWVWLTVGAYWIAPRDYRHWVLAALSIAFMASMDVVSAGLLIAAWAITSIGSAIPRMTLLMLMALGGILASALVGFKVNLAAQDPNFFQDVAIPLGMSYYVFRCLHVLIERFKGSLPQAHAKDLAQYLFFMPTFVVGPIHRFDTFVRDRDRQRFDPALMLDGAERVLIGYLKIVVLSNFLVEGVLGAYLAGLGPDNAWQAAYLGMVRDGLNIYLQFSGHCDIAIGFAYMVGHRVMENFDWPYLKHNISEFWKSWHMSLSRWCREYLYGMVVAKSRSPALGAIATMILIGLWHEISLRYLSWSLWHACGIIVWQIWRDMRSQSRDATQTGGGVTHVISVLLTLHFVWLSFVILTTPNLSDVPARMLAIMTGIGA